MSTPTVSAIVTTYNRRELLKETILSILNQTYKDFELIVVDNYSNYDFFELIESFHDDRIIPFQNQNNGIIAVNRNFGISKAKGKYLAFCDDDDLWMPEKLEKQISKADSKKNVLISSCREIIDDNNSHLRDEKWSYKNKYSIYYRNKIALSSVLVSNTPDVIFDEDKLYFAVEDYCLWLKLFHKKYEIIFVQDTLLRYREGTGSVGRVYTYLPPKEIAYLSSMIVTYKDTASKYHYFKAVIQKLFLFARYLVRESR